MAVSFTPIVGPILSCVIDGTFVDMWNAIRSGDWATFGMCALTFVPCGKVLKGAAGVVKGGLKTFGRGALNDVVKGMEKTVIKKGTKIFRAGNDIEPHGRWYTKTPLKGLSRQEVKLGTNLPATNPATTVYEFEARRDFVAYVGRSENAGVFDEMFIPGRGSDDILKLLSKRPTWLDI
jgi:hypothetical protein